MSARARVIIVGGGFGGIGAARALRDADVDVTLVDANNYHLFQPLLYQVAIAGLDADDVAYPIRGIVRRRAKRRRSDDRQGGSVAFRLARVSRIDVEVRAVVLDDGERLAYDHLVVASGAVTNTFGVVGADVNALGMKTMRDALMIRSAVLRRFEQAAADEASGRALQPSVMRIAIVGAGPTGVELAGGMQELVGRVLRRDFPTLPFEHAGVTLIEATDRLLGTFAPQLGSKAARTLQRMGVELELGTGVAAVDPGAVVLADGRRVEAGTIIWAAGVKAGPLAAASGLLLGRGGRVVVDEHLRIPGHPEVYVVGDVAASLGASGDVLPQVAQVAIQGRSPRGSGDRRSCSSAVDRPVPLHGQGIDGHDRASCGRVPVPERAEAVRPGRLGRMARVAPHLPRRLSQPPERLRQLDVELPHLRPRQPVDRRRLT